MQDVFLRKLGHSGRIERNKSRYGHAAQVVYRLNNRLECTIGCRLLTPASVCTTSNHRHFTYRMEDGDKASISHNEMPVTSEPNVSPLTEEEPAGGYQVRWKTLMAVFALSMANCCAAIANTVCSTVQELEFFVTVCTYCVS